MNDESGAKLLARHNLWANRRLYHALEDFSGASRSENGQLQPMLRMMNHLRVIGLVWQAHLTSRPHRFAERIPADVPPLENLRSEQSELDQWYLQYADQLDPQRCDEAVDFEFIGGGSGRMTRQQILLHVCMHNSYHRGYVAQLLIGAGSKPPTMDLPVFVRDGEHS